MRPAPILLCSLLFAVSASAQNLEVIAVPWSALDSTVPHAAYNGHATTLKAIARGGNGTYVYEWDFQGDGTYDFSASTTNRYNLSTRFTYPNQAVSVTFNARVRVTSAAETVVATYPVRVYAGVPADPASATDVQLQLMRNVAIDDALWFLHNQMSRSGDERNPITGAQLTGNIGGTPYAAGAFLEALGRNQRYPAFPAAYAGTMPNPQENAQRWATDPYAEDAARLTNYLLAQACPVAVGTNPSNTQSAPNDESNATGFYPESAAPPIPGTDDGFGVMTCDQNVGSSSSALRGLAAARLAGYVAQVGDQNRILGRKLEFVIQQWVDAIVWAQNDGGSYPGSWYYTPNANAELLTEQFNGGSEAAAGLWAADVFMRAHGVIVPNIAKVRLVSYVFQGSRSCNGGTGGSMFVGGCDFAASAAHTFALAWVGANLNATTDPRVAFPGYSLNVNPTRGQLRTQLNSSLAFIANTFLQQWPGTQNWDTGFVVGGDFGRTDGQGNIHAMLQWTRAARVQEPELVLYGTHDWARLFSRYLIRNQLADGNVQWVYSLGANPDNAAGPALRTAMYAIILSPDEQPPLLSANASVASAAEGTRITFTAQSSAPGTVTWTFGNGGSATGASVDYTYPDDGAFNVTATITTPGGATAVEVVPLTITNVAPVANAGPDLTLDEGSTVTFTGAFTDPGTADTHTFRWSFGDGTQVTARNPSHTYAEQGSFTATFTVTDDDLGTHADSATVTVRNVAPTITSTPGTSATVGNPYSYTLTFTDPGTTDTHTCSVMTAPTGATFTNCALSWTPTAAQAGAPQAFILCVTDDDNARTCASFTVAVPIADTDADGLPDSWEMTFFGSLTAQNGSGDPDMDGVTNAAELAADTDPTVFDGPSAPTLPMPQCSTRVANNRPTLTVTNATDPQASALTYEFEVYQDASLTTLAAEATGVPAGVGTTSWRVTVTLQEDATYYWRARAADASVYGAWSMPVCSFTVNVTNSLPTAPRPDMPSDGSSLTTTTPTLVVGNAVDPEGDPLTYEFEVFRGAARVASMTNVAEGTTTTRWTVTNMLMEDGEYTWHARAVSPGGAGPYSARSSFRINTANAAPPAPAIVSPQQGTALDTLSPRLVFLPVIDVDGDAVVYDWELAAGDSFDAPLASGTDVTDHQLTLPAPLTEDTRYCWRVRSDDGQAQSAWTRACFIASAADGAPGVPTLINPTSGRVVETLTPVFAWAGTTDPERAAVTYDLELKTGDTVVTTLSGIAGKTALIPEPLTDATSYTWRVRAHAGIGPSSEWSDAAGFSVKLPEGTTPTTTSGCGCGATGGWAMLPLALAMLLRRRRR